MTESWAERKHSQAMNCSELKFQTWSFFSVSVCISVALLSVLAVSGPVQANIHTVFTTECGPYFTWQSLGKHSSYT